VIIRIGKVFVGLVMPEVEGVMRLMSTSYAIPYFRQIVSGLVVF
jgi:hypothetical protein